MLPSGSRKLKLSKMSMGGIGGKMMRYIMNRKGIDSLESLRQQGSGERCGIYRLPNVHGRHGSETGRTSGRSDNRRSSNIHGTGG